MMSEEVKVFEDILLTHNLDVASQYNKLEYTRYDMIRMHYAILKDIISYPERVAKDLKNSDIDQATAEAQLSSLLNNTDEVLRNI